MDFILLNNNLRYDKISCNVVDQFKIKKIIFGSGGSNNIILDVDDLNKNNKLIIKIIPDFIYFNVKIKPNHDQLEIKFYQFFTKKYLLTARTPHIVGIYSYQKCSQIDKLLKKIAPDTKICPSYEDRLRRKIKPNIVNEKLCDLLLQHEMKILGPDYDIVLLEYCPYELRGVIQWHLYQIKNSKRKQLYHVINNFIHELNRILFQTIFTLAIIKDDYPGFLHGDFFVRNILISYEDTYELNDFVAYYYKQRIFYLPANGPYSKFNDFGLSVIANEIEPNTYEFEKILNKLYHRNPFNQKSDIFNLLHDIYDGQNLGTSSINRWAVELGISSETIKPIRKFLNNFIKVNTIDQINGNNSMLLDDTWNIDGIKILEDTVATPNEYLTKKYFTSLQTLPKEAKIIRHFNKPM